MKADALDKRVVVDTNVWLSAALSPAGAPSQVLRRVLAYGVPVFSLPTFAELEARIWRLKFDRYLTMQARQEILHDARALGPWGEISPSISAQRYSRDEDDDKFIHTAQAGAAKWLITGDLDLLSIEADSGVRIIATAQALLLEKFLPE